MNKNKMIIIVCIGLMLVTLITAQIINTRNTNITLTRTEKSNLTKVGIISPQTTPLKCDTQYCYYKMYQITGHRNITNGTLINNELAYFEVEVHYNLGEHRITRGSLSRLELEALQESQITQWLKDYSNVLAKRENVNSREVISNETQITIRQKAR